MLKVDGFLDGTLDFDFVTRTVGEDVGGNVEATVGRYEYLGKFPGFPASFGGGV